MQTSKTNSTRLIKILVQKKKKIKQTNKSCLKMKQLVWMNVTLEQKPGGISEGRTRVEPREDENKCRIAR